MYVSTGSADAHPLQAGIASVSLLREFRTPPKAYP